MSMWMNLRPNMCTKEMYAAFLYTWALQPSSFQTIENEDRNYRCLDHQYLKHYYHICSV